MGQAKQRGTYEERKKLAIEKEAKEHAAWSEIQRRKPSTKLSKTTAMVMSALAGYATEYKIR